MNEFANNLIGDCRVEEFIRLLIQKGIEPQRIIDAALGEPAQVRQGDAYDRAVGVCNPRQLFATLG